MGLGTMKDCSEQSKHDEAGEQKYYSQRERRTDGANETL